jgi:hypothetical protein
MGERGYDRAEQSVEQAVGQIRAWSLEKESDGSLFDPFTSGSPWLATKHINFSIISN